MRREIEKGLREKEVTALCHNALELGLTLRPGCLLDCSYPGTIASTYSRLAGGRRSEKSLAVLIARSQPLDQIHHENPDYFFGQSPEHGLINPDNLLILSHIQCAAFELPFAMGALRREDLGEMLRYLEEKEPFIMSAAIGMEQDAYLRRRSVSGRFGGKFCGGRYHQKKER